jgi:hypothetical protein
MERFFNHAGRIIGEYEKNLQLQGDRQERKVQALKPSISSGLKSRWF